MCMGPPGLWVFCVIPWPAHTRAHTVPSTVHFCRMSLFLVLEKAECQGPHVSFSQLPLQNITNCVAKTTDIFKSHSSGGRKPEITCQQGGIPYEGSRAAPSASAGFPWVAGTPWCSVASRCLAPVSISVLRLHTPFCAHISLFL